MKSFQNVTAYVQVSSEKLLQNCNKTCNITNLAFPAFLRCPAKFHVLLRGRKWLYVSKLHLSSPFLLWPASRLNLCLISVEAKGTTTTTRGHSELHPVNVIQITPGARLCDVLNRTLHMPVSGVPTLGFFIPCSMQFTRASISWGSVRGRSTRYEHQQDQQDQQSKKAECDEED